jgi:hypothetical protein
MRTYGFTEISRPVPSTHSVDYRAEFAFMEYRYPRTVPGVWNLRNKGFCCGYSLITMMLSSSLRRLVVFELLLHQDSTQLQSTFSLLLEQ